MQSDPLPAFERVHAEVWALLPWLVNRSLRAEEEALARGHLETCLPCRREAALLETLALHTRAPGQDAECEAALRRLNRRIASAPSVPRAIPWTAAAVLALCTTLVAWAAGNAHQSTAWLRNAGVSWSQAEGDASVDDPLGPQVSLVFHEDVTERELRSIVLAVGAVVIEGPTPDGRYRLAFLRQMSPGELLEALRQLRYAWQVLYAEPVFSTTRISSTGRG